nr:MAG TPA: hypothetical protein [Caudoviricetes sp.]
MLAIELNHSFSPLGFNSKNPRYACHGPKIKA